MYKWRWLAQLIARVGGWFWLPCEMCGQHYAGFEASWVAVADGPSCGKVICKGCGAVIEAWLEKGVVLLYEGSSYRIERLSWFGMVEEGGEHLGTAVRSG